VTDGSRDGNAGSLRGTPARFGAQYRLSVTANLLAKSSLNTRGERHSSTEGGGKNNENSATDPPSFNLQLRTKSFAFHWNEG
jgi:hypothetical protein